ncbi:AraC family transcriptional regulator [Agarivorans sp. B2Z047]|uniref:AraC family transcriptional regulator n=1 Tax=Agarivorans sp. B2Z047 TaxID=2652721 RepID=UPI00128C80A1|nr:AraC family transcriptional regulator [Agarivorans sp. B2Z047]MPW27549.1 AraC family transcriptional regulator [Agarivorans sp. B2Z047]UQN44610.1 helix-turn-helix transcriptional regulator [Agarivorans sp. B2Z047]
MHRINNFSRIAEHEYALSTDSLNMLFYALPKHFSDQYRSYDAPRLCTILDGEKKVSVNQSENFVYTKDQFILIPPHASVHMTMPESTKALVYEFGDQIIDYVGQRVADNLQLDPPQQFSDSTFALSAYSERTAVLHQRIQEILQDQDKNMRFLIDLTCQEMVYELMKLESCNEIIQHHKNHPINIAIRIFGSNDNAGISVSQVAEEVGMSLSNFSQKFKQTTKYTPKEYMTKLRLKRSKLHLKNMSVTDTAFETGYDNISHFIRLFKKEYGMTPKQYQLTGRDHH